MGGSGPYTPGVFQAAEGVHQGHPYRGAQSGYAALPSHRSEQGKSYSRATWLEETPEGRRRQFPLGTAFLTHSGGIRSLRPIRSLLNTVAQAIGPRLVD